MESSDFARKLKGPLKATGSALVTVGLLSAAELHMLTVAPNRRADIFDRWLRRWAKGILAVNSVRLLHTGQDPAVATRPRLLVANHRSAFDVPVILSLFGGRMLSRADLANWPILGIAARRAGVIFVERDEKSSRSRAVRAIRRHLAGGATITVFPEGTTYKGDEVRPFFPGAFAALRGLNVEVIPIGLAYPPDVEWFGEGFRSHMGRVAMRPQIRVGVAIGSPIAVEGAARGVADRTRNEVQELALAARRLL